jgi:gamma-glutamylcyclotransferase (GGCT)/AIG2-like uncharacterized protein YtfP
MSNVRELFVYGTLKQGGKWHHLVSNEHFVGEDAIEGEMYLEKGGTYPILFVGTDIIKGETQKDPNRRIQEFNAPEFFRQWLSTTDHNSESFREFLAWGGQVPKPPSW